MEDCCAGVFDDSTSVEIGFDNEDLLFGVLRFSSVNVTLGRDLVGRTTYFLQIQDLRKRRTHFFQHPLGKAVHDAQLWPLLENPERRANASHQLKEMGAQIRGIKKIIALVEHIFRNHINRHSTASMMNIQHLSRL